MPSDPDKTKRLAVRFLLLQADWQRASDREVAKEAGVSRGLVKAVRSLMIGAGEIPAFDPPRHTGPRAAEAAYKPGGSARGGYVYDEDGTIIRETVWLAKLAAKKKGKKGK